MKLACAVATKVAKSCAFMMQLYLKLYSSSQLIPLVSHRAETLCRSIMGEYCNVGK
jgi:hypothetical protein